ncbi:MAG: hypothetical protein V1809_06680 [Planctomycetota bacterium]
MGSNSFSQKSCLELFRKLLDLPGSTKEEGYKEVYAFRGMGKTGEKYEEEYEEWIGKELPGLKGRNNKDFELMTSL